MKISIFAIIAAFTPLYPLAAAVNTRIPQQNVTLSVFVAENISSYLEGNQMVFETNLTNPLFISVVNKDNDHFQYIETQQKLRVPVTPGSTLTITESL